MLKLESNGSGEIRLSMAGEPNAICVEMTSLVERFTYKLLTACRNAEAMPDTAAQLATGFALAVRNGLALARKEAHREAEDC